MQLKFEKHPHEQDIVILFAFRYALGRESMAPSIMSDTILENKDILKPKTLETIIEEIDVQKKMGLLGDTCDEYTWEYLKEQLIEYLANKKD